MRSPKTIYTRVSLTQPNPSTKESVDEGACQALENVKSQVTSHISELEAEVVTSVTNILYHAALALNSEHTCIGSYPVESLIQIGFDLSTLPVEQHDSLQDVADKRALLEDAAHLLAVTKEMRKHVTDVPAAERLHWAEKHQREATMLVSRTRNCEKLSEKLGDHSCDVSVVIDKAKEVAESVSCLVRQSGQMTLDNVCKTLNGLEQGGTEGKSWRAGLGRDASVKQALAAARRVGIYEGDHAEVLHKSFHSAQEDHI